MSDDNEEKMYSKMYYEGYRFGYTDGLIDCEINIPYKDHKPPKSFATLPKYIRDCYVRAYNEGYENSCNYWNNR
jgi:hypothetical protein